MASLIPQTFLDELLQATNIVELIDSYVPLKKSGTSYVACCPFHHEKGPSFNVITKKQFYHCFGCGASGNAISFIMNYLHLGFVETVEMLASRVGLEVPKEGTSSNYQEKLSLYQLLSRVCNYYQKQLKKNPIAIDYLKKRQITGKTALFYQLGFAPNGWNNLENNFKQYKQELLTTGMLIQNNNGKIYDRYRNRIMFPIHDRNGRIIGFGGRVLDKTQKPKYLNSPETPIFQKSREVYGLHQLLQIQAQPQQIIVTEGYMDVIALQEHKINNAVATLGTATSLQHLQLLSKHSKKIIFCFDGDDAGRHAAIHALDTCFQVLDNGLEIVFIFLPEGEDPDSFIKNQGKEKFLEKIENAISLNEFFINTITKDVNISSLSGKTQLINNAKPYIVKMKNSAYKQLLLDELSRLTRIDYHRLVTLLEEKTIEKNNNKTNLNISRSPLRVATALLLQKPEIYANSDIHIEPGWCDGVNQEILKKLIEQINANPKITTGMLVELWRDTSDFDVISKLAFWDHKVPENQEAKEFFEIVLFLLKQNKELKVLKLLEKSKKNGLTEPEKLELQEFLKNRHNIGYKELN